MTITDQVVGSIASRAREAGVEARERAERKVIMKELWRLHRKSIRTAFDAVLKTAMEGCRDLHAATGEAAMAAVEFTAACATRVTEPPAPAAGPTTPTISVVTDPVGIIRAAPATRQSGTVSVVPMAGTGPGARRGQEPFPPRLCAGGAEVAELEPINGQMPFVPLAWGWMEPPVVAPSRVPSLPSANARTAASTSLPGAAVEAENGESGRKSWPFVGPYPNVPPIGPPLPSQSREQASAQRRPAGVMPVGNGRASPTRRGR